MKSGLEGRNNRRIPIRPPRSVRVSMKSGLEGRNNLHFLNGLLPGFVVSMKSGLEGRNNLVHVRNQAASALSQ